MTDKEEVLSKDFSDLLGRASTLERRRAERSRVKNLAGGLEKSSPRNLLSTKDNNASVRNLAKRFEIPDAQSISSQGTETTASTSTTTATTTKRSAGTKSSEKNKPSMGHSSPSTQPSAKVLMAHAAFAGTPKIMEKLPPKRTSTSSTITDKLPPKRTSTVASRAAVFAPDIKSANTESSPTRTVAPMPSPKMKFTHASFSGTPAITKILPEKRTSTTSPAWSAKPANMDTAEPSQFFKLAQAAFSGFSGTPVVSQSGPPKRTPTSAGKIASSPVPSPKMQLAKGMFSGTPAIAQSLPPKRTSAPAASKASANPGFFAAWNNTNALTQPSNNPAPPAPPSYGYGFGKSPSLAIPAATPRRQQAPEQSPASTTRDEHSFRHSPEQQEVYKERSRILKDPTASTTEKLRMYLTSVKEPEGKQTVQESGEKRTGLDAELDAINIPFSYGGNRSNEVPVPQSSSTHHVEIVDKLIEDSASDNSDSSPTFSDRVSKSIDKVIWNYSGNYTDDPRGPPPSVPPVDNSSKGKRSGLMDVDISKDGIDDFDFVEDDDDIFHDEYVVTHAKQRKNRQRFILWLCLWIAAASVTSLLVVFGFGLHETLDDHKSVSSEPWTGDCFGNKLELRMAVDRFLQDESPTSDLAAKYGWPINSWCVGELDDFSYLFRAQVGDGGSPVRLTSFNEDISAWDVSNGRFFNEMFLGANFNQDLSRWNVGNAIDMERMFDDSSFTGDLSSWDVKNVKNTKFMFRNARNFRSDLSKWQFAPDTMEGMFFNAEAFSSDLNGFDVSNVRDFAGVFSGASSFNGDISEWKMEGAERLDNLFKDAELFNGDLSKWSVKPSSMESTFYGTSSFTGGSRGLQNWDTSEVNDMGGLFAFSKFQADISSWIMISVTNTKEMFLGCQSFDGDLSKWDVSSVKDFSSMFEGANAFSSDLSQWDVSSGTKFDRMFAGTSSFNKDLSMWNITSVRSMAEMFANATSYSKDLCSWGPLLNQTFEKPDDLDISQWSLFSGTRCPQKATLPDFSATPPGPFCHPCSE
ncbi:MAG: hypothetical protein SGBAC_002433 [Bacillariaceae sp.]